MSSMLTDRVPRKGGSRERRILIVEDDAQSRWALSTLMQRIGYDCEVASNGEEALVKAADYAPQVILMDSMMPVLDGLEATRRLKADARTRDIPVLMLTGDVTRSSEIAARRAGCDDFISKPIILDELLDRLRKHFQHD